MTTAAATQGPRKRRVPEWTLADRLRKIRADELDLHQHEFAEQLGVTKSAYAAWEAGRTTPRDILAVAKRIELLSGVPATWTLGLDGPETITEAHTGGYQPQSARVSRSLLLVDGDRDDYPVVAAVNGSSPAALSEQSPAQVTQLGAPQGVHYSYAA